MRAPGAAAGRRGGAPRASRRWVTLGGLLLLARTSPGAAEPMPWGGPRQLLLTPNPFFPPEPGSPGSASDGAVQEEAEESHEGSRSPAATPDRSTRECLARPPYEGLQALPVSHPLP